MPKVKNKMSEEDRRNLELMYEDLRVAALGTLALAIACWTTSFAILNSVRTILGQFASIALLLLGGLFGWDFYRTVRWKRSIILKKLGIRKTAEKYGLVKRRKLRKK